MHSLMDIMSNISFRARKKGKTTTENNQIRISLCTALLGWTALSESCRISQMKTFQKK